MRRLLALAFAALVAFGLVRLLASRRTAPAPVVEAAPDRRAQELRRRLDESRAVVAEREEFEGGETPIDVVESAPDPDARRRRVHEGARAVADRMRDGTAPG